MGGTRSDTQRYLMTTDWVLRNTDATARSLRSGGRRVKLATGVPYRFLEQPVVGPQVVTVTVQVRDEDWRAVSALGERMAMAASSQYARVYRELSAVRVEYTLPRGEWRDVYLGELPHRPNAATIGRKALGPSARVGWDPPHKALFGATRSGKTTCLADFVMSLAKHPPEVYRFVIINPKNDRALHPFRRLPHLAVPVADNYEDGLTLLRFVLAEMEKRRGDARESPPRLVVIVDEVAQLVERYPEAGALITQLTQMAGGLGIHLVLASQAANPKVFGSKGSLAKANLTSRVVFQLPHDQSYMATGMADQHPELLGGQGDGLAIVNGRVTRIRAALPQERDYEELPRAESEPEWPGEERLAGGAAIVAGWQVPPEMAHYALFEKRSATQIYKKFGGAMQRARSVRDWAAEFTRIHNAWKREQRSGGAEGQGSG